MTSIDDNVGGKWRMQAYPRYEDCPSLCQRECGSPKAECLLECLDESLYIQAVLKIQFFTQPVFRFV